MGVSDKTALDVFTSWVAGGESDELAELFSEYLNGTTDKSVDSERKTRVVSKRTLKALEALAADHQVSRDWVFECVVRVAVGLEKLERKRMTTNLNEARRRADALADHNASELAEIRKLTEGSEVEIPAVDGLAEDLATAIQDELKFYESLDGGRNAEKGKRSNGKGRKS